MIYVLSGATKPKQIAFIDVIYPEGSTVTATNGIDVISLKCDTGGTGIIGVPSLGSWVVSCTDGTNIKSQTVELTQNGQTVIVEIHYFEAYIKVTTEGTVFSTELSFSNGTNQYYHTMTDNGSYQFTVYSPGTWTIVGKRNGQNITKTITVSVNGSINNVNLFFRQYLFKAGSGSYTSWTTGGGTFGTTWITNRTDYLKHTVGGYNSYVSMAYLYSNSSLNLTNYTKFVITGYGDAWGLMKPTLIHSVYLYQKVVL